MAIWIEPTIATGPNLYGITALCTAPAQRANYTALIPNWIGETIQNDNSLDEDSPIIVSLQLKAKWGL